ncbi:MAG: hypothetical protein K8S23_08500 [Candidatus Cloacimonetes bacterium]|nr:hypothetical protein [Candidatus Cloacimonadota bacterium]
MKHLIIILLLFSGIMGVFAKNRLDAPINYLVIANSTLEGNQSLIDFISWKTEKGFQITTHFVDSTATIEEIDLWVEQQYESMDPNPQFLLLIGDSNGPFTVKTQEDNLPPGPGDIISDLIYGVIGDITSTNRIPEIFVGRFSVRTEEDLAVQVNKTIWYEKEQFITSADISFLENALGVSNNNEAYFLYRNAVIAYGWDYYFNDTYVNPYTGTTNSMNGITYTYPHADTLTLISNIIGDINDGIAFYFYIGNADKVQLKFPFFTIDDVNNLENQYEYPVVAIGG